MQREVYITTDVCIYDLGGGGVCVRACVCLGDFINIVTLKVLSKHQLIWSPHSTSFTKPLSLMRKLDATCFLSSFVTGSKLWSSHKPNPSLLGL